MSIPKNYRRNIRRSLLYLYFLSYLLHAFAQSYTTLDEKTLYLIPALQKPQLFSLDLTRSWEAEKAPLDLLSAPPLDHPYLYMAALAVNYDKKSLLYFNSHRTPSVYNITTRTWQLGTRLTNPNATTVLPKSIYSNQVAIDPSSGIAYIPSVEHFDNFPMFTYNTSQGYTSNVTKTIVPGVSIPYDKYGAIWSTVRKSILFYGGEINGFTPVGLMEYQPSSNQWTGVKTQGATTPGNVSLPCIASAYNGMKMVMFGNYERPYSVFILDIKTLVWTKGADPRPGEERNNAACTVVGDYFIVAGGSPSLGGGVLQPVIVYNIKMNQWTDSYEAPNTPSASTSGGNSSTTETSLPVADKEQRSGEGMNSGTRIGIIAGGSSILLILLTCGAFLIHRQKKRKSRQAPQQLRHDSNPPPSSPNGHLRLRGAREPQYHSFKASSPSLHGLLRPQVARNPQQHSSSIPTRAIQQWQCAQQERDLQYIPPPPSAPTKPALVQYLQHGLQDERGNYHDHLDHHAFYHDQRRSDSQDDPDYYNHTADYSAMHHNRHLNDPQPSYGDYNDEDYLTVNRHPRINAPQKYGHSFTEEGVSFSNNQRRLDPQDHTRRSTASQLEFYQARPFNSPQDYGNKVGRDHGTPHQEIRRIRGQQEEYMLR